MNFNLLPTMSGFSPAPPLKPKPPALQASSQISRASQPSTHFSQPQFGSVHEMVIKDQRPGEHADLTAAQCQEIVRRATYQLKRSLFKEEHVSVYPIQPLASEEGETALNQFLTSPFFFEEAPETENPERTVPDAWKDHWYAFSGADVEWARLEGNGKHFEFPSTDPAKKPEWGVAMPERKLRERLEKPGVLGQEIHIKVFECDRNNLILQVEYLNPSTNEKVVLNYPADSPHVLGMEAWA